MLQQQDALHEGIIVARVAFHEITESSIKCALQAPRDINANLVHAYLARRALDYLIGFNISPLLWRKLPGCQSAGRVQSAALSLICDREMEIEEFKAQEYWTFEVDFHQLEKKGVSFHSHLTHLDAKKLDKLSIRSQAEAEAIERKITSLKFLVVDAKKSKMQRNRPMPYITSTLQQDAANRLQFSACYTMKVNEYSKLISSTSIRLHYRFYFFLISLMQLIFGGVSLLLVNNLSIKHAVIFFFYPLH